MKILQNCNKLAFETIILAILNGFGKDNMKVIGKMKTPNLYKKILIIKACVWMLLSKNNFPSIWIFIFNTFIKGINQYQKKKEMKSLDIII